MSLIQYQVGEGVLVEKVAVIGAALSLEQCVRRQHDVTSPAISAHFIPDHMALVLRAMISFHDEPRAEAL